MEITYFGQSADGGIIFVANGYHMKLCKGPVSGRPIVAPVIGPGSDILSPENEVWFELALDLTAKAKEYATPVEAFNGLSTECGMIGE